MFPVILTRNSRSEPVAQHLVQERVCRRRLTDFGFDQDLAIVLREVADYLRPPIGGSMLEALRCLVKANQVEVVVAVSKYFLNDNPEERASILAFLKHSDIPCLLDMP